MAEPVIPATLSIHNYPWPTIDAQELLRRVEEADKELEAQRVTAQGIIDEHSARIAELEAASGELADAATEVADGLEKIVDEGMEKAGLTPCKHVSDTNDARPLSLSWGGHERDGGLHTEWYAPCGCAYHVDPQPHVHPCAKHQDLLETVAPKLTPAEAVFGVLAWLSTKADHERKLDTVIPSAMAASAAKRFCHVNGLGEVGDDWPNALTHPPEDEGAVLDTTVVDELHAILVEACIEPRSTVEAVKGGDLVDRTRRLVASRDLHQEQWEAALATKTGQATEPAPAGAESPTSGGSPA